MKDFRYLVLLAIIICGVSCKKEAILKPPNGIIFGDPERSHVIVTRLNPPLQIEGSGNGGQVSIDLDLFNDGTPDFSFHVFTQKWANKRSCEVHSDNLSLRFIIEDLSDTIFLNYNNQNPEISAAKVRFNHYSGFSSHSPNDSIDRVFCLSTPRIFEFGDTMCPTSLMHNWGQGGIMTSYMEGYDYFPTDLYHRYRFGDWNGVGPGYLCFSLEKGDITYYGWLLLEVSWNLRIDVYEYAIAE